ncbi:MAG TPA: chemotaxis protein CheC [Bacillota bacterium]|nr:chemotaxis protein CheC [Bacillota bacterium]
MEEIPNDIEPLREVTTIAAGNAATALSKLIGQDVDVVVPSVKLVAIEKVTQEVGDTAHVSSAALVKIQGDIQGVLLFTLDPLDAEAVATGTIRTQIRGDYVDQDQSVLKEMVNIVAGAALSAISKFLDLKLRPSVPDSTTDMLGAVLDPFMAEFGTQYEQVLILQEVFTLPHEAQSLKMLAVIDPPSTTKLLEQLTLKLDAGHAANN